METDGIKDKPDFEAMALKSLEPWMRIYQLGDTFSYRKGYEAAANEIWTTHVLPLKEELSLLKSREQTGWISVKDRLPECDVQHRMDYESGYRLTWDGYDVEVASYWELADGRKEWSTGSNVTHWMPLPEPPKE